MAFGDGYERLLRALEDHGCKITPGGTFAASASGAAQCPGHDDRRASLSVGQGERGAVLLCHAGCDTVDVLAGLGLSYGDLFDDPASRRRGYEVTDTYSYTDEDGEVLFYVERRFPKDFRQYRVVNGRKVWNLGGVRRVPYHLPQLLAACARGEEVYLVEGEKDVHAVEAAGAAATTNAGGAENWKKRHGYARYFRGARRVIIVADRDGGAGRKWAAAADADLAAEGIETRTVEAAEGKDASDHLVTHAHGLGDFRPLLAAAPAAAQESEALADVPVAAPETYYGILGDITRAAEPGTEADPVGILGSLLAMTGVAAGRNPHLRIGNDRHPLLVWPLLLGRTGSGRKGGATTTAELFVREALDGEYATWATSGLSSGEGLIERLRDGDGAKDEGIADKRLIVTETEFGTVMARAARDGSTLAEVCRQAWNGESLSVLNRKRLTASWSHVAVLGHIAPRDFRRRLAAADLAAGTYNRYMPLYVERSKRLPIPPGADPKVVTDLGGKLRAAVARARRHTRVQLGGDAAALWCGELYDEFSQADDDEQAWAEFTRRAAPYCLRIAGLYAVLDGRGEISTADLTAAAALVRYSAASARYVLGDLLRDPRMDRLAREVTAAGPAGLTRSQVSALFGRNLPAAQLGELLDELVAGGRFEAVEIASGGRPALAYRRLTAATGFTAYPDCEK